MFIGVFSVELTGVVSSVNPVGGWKFAMSGSGSEMLLVCWERSLGGSELSLFLFVVGWLTG